MTRSSNRLHAVGLIFILGVNMLLSGCSGESTPAPDLPTQTTPPDLRDPGLDFLSAAAISWLAQPG